MKTIAYLSGIGLFDAGIVALILGASDFPAAMLMSAGAMLGAASGRWVPGTKVQRSAGLALMTFFSVYLLVATYPTEAANSAFSLFRNPWFGIPFAGVVSIVAILQVREAHGNRARAPFKLQLTPEDIALDNAISQAAARSLASRRD